MEAKISYDTSVNVYQTTQCHVPEDTNLQNHSRDISHTGWLVSLLVTGWLVIVPVCTKKVKFSLNLIN
jgi:hypothetical protein